MHPHLETTTATEKEDEAVKSLAKYEGLMQREGPAQGLAQKSPQLDKTKKIHET